jgi:hypothetical protein
MCHWMGERDERGVRGLFTRADHAPIIPFDIFFSGHMIARLESIKNLTLSREITTLDASWDRQAVPINSRVASERGLVQIVAAMFPSTLYS